ncbi:MAG: hypothetical protein ABIH46_13010 [Chloroflexota bacterium]
MESPAKALVVAGLSVSAIFLLLRLKSNRARISLTRLFNAEAVKHLADQLPRTSEDDFILAAWQAVGQDVVYQSYGSILVFSPDLVDCQRCLLPEQVIRKMGGNCVAKSVLLVSILRNRLPSRRVYMAVGTLNHNGSSGGHAWVLVQRHGAWYVLESTMSPPLDNPWMPVSLASESYTNEATVNDKHLNCYDPSVCEYKIAVASKCPCSADRAFRENWNRRGARY